jgi:drug/metabolite transporter (DMT)-like permease
VVAAAVLWSTGGLFIKVLGRLPEAAPSALSITCYRSLFAATCLLPFARRANWPRLRDIAPSVLVYTLLLSLYVAATQGTSAANAIFLQYTAPLYALALGSWLFREPFHPMDLLPLAGAMAGIAVLFFGGFQGAERAPLLMGLGSGAMFGLFLLWLRRMRGAGPVAVTLLNNAGVALLAGLALAFTNPAELLLFPRALEGERAAVLTVAGLAAMGAVQIAAPYVLFSIGLRRVPALEGSLLALLEPVLNPLWVMLATGEVPARATLAGGAMIVLSLLCRYTVARPPRGADVP